MSVAEHLEHASHIGHAGGHGGHGHDEKPGNNLGRRIGISMAILGVLLALCSAMLGTARSQLSASMVSQNNAAAEFQSASTKYRVLMSQLQMQHALLPTDPQALVNAEKKIAELATANAGKDWAAVVEIERLEFAKVLNTITPSPADSIRMVGLARTYDTEKETAKDWRDSYQGAISAHEHAEHHFEWALLAAEFALVICSVALLLQSRAFWFAALALGATSAIIVAVSFISYRSATSDAAATIATAKTKFDQLDRKTRRTEDEKLLNELETSQKAMLDQPAK
jgi:hypothetical protein